MAMLKTLTIDGVKYPFLFGFYAMLYAEEELGVNIDKILDGNPEPLDMLRVLPAFTLSGIKNGQYTTGKDTDITLQEIKIAFDKDPGAMKRAEALVAQALNDFTTARLESGSDEKADTAKKGRQGVKPQA
jgi:hypothetical protein